MSVKLSEFTPARLMSLYKSKTSLLLVGAPGVGKSAIIGTWPSVLSKMTGEDFGWHMITPSNRESAEMKGFMIPSKNAKGKPVSQYTYPAIFPTEEYLEEHPFGVLNIEEADQCEQDQARVLASVFYERRLDDVYLPDGWWVVASTNAAKHKSGVGRPMKHVINRQRRIEVANDVEGLCRWMSTRDVHPMFIAFTRARPSVVFTDEVPVEAIPFCTPRSLMSAATYMKEVVGSSMEFRVGDFEQEMVAGDIGMSAAAELFGFAAVHTQIPTMEEIEQSPVKAKVPELGRLDGVYAVTEMIIAYANRKNIEAIMEYVERLPRQFVLATVRRIVDKHPMVVADSPRLRAWLAKNKDLVGSSMA